MDSNRERIVFMIVVGVALVLAIAMGFIPAAYSEVGVALGLFSLFFATVAFTLKDYSYIAEPFLRMKNRTIVLDANEPFYVSANGKAIIIRSGNLVYATSFIKMPIYKSSTEMSDEDKFNFSTVFSKAISISAAPMRMSSQLYLVGKDEYLHVITDKLNEVEDRYNSLLNDKGAPKTAVDRVKGEVNMWHNLMDNVTQSNLQAQIAFVTVSAVGGTEDEAVNLSSLNAEQLSAGLSTALGVPTTVANGADMLLFVEPDMLIPTTATVGFASGQK